MIPAALMSQEEKKNAYQYSDFSLGVVSTFQINKGLNEALEIYSSKREWLTEKPAAINQFFGASMAIDDVYENGQKLYFNLQMGTTTRKASGISPYTNRQSERFFRYRDFGFFVYYGFRFQLLGIKTNILPGLGLNYMQLSSKSESDNYDIFAAIRFSPALLFQFYPHLFKDKISFGAQFYAPTHRYDLYGFNSRFGHQENHNYPLSFAFSLNYNIKL